MIACINLHSTVRNNPEITAGAHSHESCSCSCGCFLRRDGQCTLSSQCLLPGLSTGSSIREAGVQFMTLGFTQHCSVFAVFPREAWAARALERPESGLPGSSQCLAPNHPLVDFLPGQAGDLGVMRTQLRGVCPALWSRWTRSPAAGRMRSSWKRLLQVWWSPRSLTLGGWSWSCSRWAQTLRLDVKTPVFCRLVPWSPVTQSQMVDLLMCYQWVAEGDAESAPGPSAPYSSTSHMQNCVRIVYVDILTW